MLNNPSEQEIIENQEALSHISQVIKDRFVIGQFLDAGSFGKVYKVTDVTECSRQLIIKICRRGELLTNEIEALENIYASTEEGEKSYVVDSGFLTDSSPYFIM